MNVVPITAEGNAVLIRQFRHGIRDVTMETPGGMMDEGETPEAAAARELREETGYVAEKIRLLARVLPNPAVQNNFLYLLLRKDVATRERRSLTPSSPSRLWNARRKRSPK
jgi:8-oxo-dGTP pyrophosphatase MutT (NUDIX family)